MATKAVANQRIIKYADYDYEHFPVELVRHLDSSEMQFYMYLWSMHLRRTNKLMLSSSHVMDDTGMSYKTYSKAFHSLVQDGFLVADTANIYIFCPDKYRISDDELMHLIFEYIYNNYPQKIKTERFIRYEDELDIYPEQTETNEDYLKNFDSQNDCLPF